MKVSVVRILIIASAYPKPGNMAYAFVHARAKIYMKKGHELEVFVPSKQNAKYVVEGARVTSGNIESYKDCLESFDPDVAALHSPFYLNIRSHVKRLSERGTPIAVWIHGSEAIFHASLSGYVAPWEIKEKFESVIFDPLKLVLLRQLFLKSDAVVFVSRWMQTYTERCLSFKHPFSVVIPNPVDMELFSYKRKDFGNAREGIAVRGLGWKYGLDVAIRAYSSLDKTHLTIVGSGTMENYLRDLAQKCRSNVSFVTDSVSHDKMPELYDRFGYFVAPSRVEAQGVAMCEAMACGLPVIATNVGGIPEFVKNEENGLLIPPENPQVLREAVTHLLSSKQLYSTLSEQAAKSVKEKLSSDIIYAKEYALLKACTKR